MTHCPLHYLHENGGGAQYWPGTSGVRDVGHSKFPVFGCAAAKSTPSLSAKVSSGFSCVYDRGDTSQLLQVRCSLPLQGPSTITTEATVGT